MKKEEHIKEIKRLKKVKLEGSCLYAACLECHNQCETPGTFEYNEGMKMLDNKLKELEL